MFGVFTLLVAVVVVIFIFSNKLNRKNRAPQIVGERKVCKICQCEMPASQVACKNCSCSEFFVGERTTTSKHSMSHLPEQFIVFDLETTGLDVSKNEIIEIAAIRVNRDTSKHDFIQALVKPSKQVPAIIVSLTGLTQEMLENEGDSLDETIEKFAQFAGDLRLVSFNAEFDMAFLNAASQKCGRRPFSNPVSCALKMARRAWPGRKSYKLADIAKDGNLDSGDTHRALADSKRALTVYTTAASILRTASRKWPNLTNHS